MSNFRLFQTILTYDLCLDLLTYSFTQKGVLDAARRSDRSGEWESVDIGDDYDSSLKFQHEMSLYCEVIDQLQI